MHVRVVAALGSEHASWLSRGSIERPARASAGQAFRVEHVHAIHDDVLDADGILMRLLVRRRVADGRGIEDDEIRKELLADAAAIANADLRGRGAGHAMQRFLKTEDLVVADVL